MLDLPPVWECLSLFQIQCVLLYSAELCVSCSSWKIPLLPAPGREGMGSFTCSMSGVCVDYRPVSAEGQDCWPWGTDAHY